MCLIAFENVTMWQQLGVEVISFLFPFLLRTHTAYCGHEVALPHLPFYYYSIIGSICFPGCLLLLLILIVINVQPHAAHCRGASTITTKLAETLSHKKIALK